MKQFEKQIVDLPKIVEWCKKCTISNQRPRLHFDKNGVCSACNNVDYKNSIDWDKRESELIKLLDSHRSDNGNWDVIVPSSGGKDSGYVAHVLKYKYNMNPLLVTWSPLKYTLIGIENFNNLNNSGFQNIKCSQNGIINSVLSRLCLEEFGDAFHTFVLGQVYFPVHMALKFNIKLIFYGENGELEYAGDPKSKDKPYNDFLKNEKWIKGYLKGTPINELVEYGLKNKNYMKDLKISKSDLAFYNPPDKNEMISKNISKQYFMNYFLKWQPQENYYYCAQNTGLMPNPERSEGTYSKYASLDDKFDGFHYYMRYIKLGLGRCAEDTAHEIRDGHITRQEGLDLMKKYEGEFPKKHFKEFLEYLHIDEKIFEEIVNSWRLDHIWEKKNNEWVMIKPIWK